MKQRNYKKGNPHRDCRLFVIVAEGEREDEYFSFFNEQNQRIAISNPSFEVWLLYHVCSEIDVNETNLKNLLHQKVSTGYNRDAFCAKIAQAAENAKNADTHPNQIFPNIMLTKVYLLAREMLSVLKM